jgi:hypothetical protein
VTPLLAYLALAVSVAAVCCGHQGEPCPIPLRGVWRHLRAPHRGTRASRDTRTPPVPAESHTTPSAPTWAHTDKDAA